MSGRELQVDPALLESLAGALRTSGTALNEAGAAQPPMPDGGDMTADMAALLSTFTEATGHLAMGMWWAGDQVAVGGGEYSETEQTVHGSFNQYE